MGDSASRSEVYDRDFRSVADRLDFIDERVVAATIAGGGGVWPVADAGDVEGIVTDLDAEGYDSGAGAAVVVKLRAVREAVGPRVPGEQVVEDRRYSGDGWTWYPHNRRGRTGTTEPEWPGVEREGVLDGDGITAIWWDRENVALTDGVWTADTTLLDYGFIVADGRVWEAWNYNGPTGATEPDWSAAPNFGDTLEDGGVTWRYMATVFEWSATSDVTRTVHPTFYGNADGAVPVFTFPAGSGHCYEMHLYGIATVPNAAFDFDSGVERLADGPIMWSRNNPDAPDDTEFPQILSFAADVAPDGRILMVKGDPTGSAFRLGVPRQDTSMPVIPGYGFVEGVDLEDDGGALYAYEESTDRWLLLFSYRED